MQRAGSLRRPFTIVGGTYYERCESPPWNALYGSGLRAAASLSARDWPISLHTCADARASGQLRSVAVKSKTTTQITSTDRTPGFHYLHPLAVPSISHHADSDPPASLEVAADSILCFGMLEAKVVVHGDRVVYDPQSPYQPQHFAANGSTARRLAIVANRQEATILADTSDLREAGARLRGQAEIVVIKDGPNGAVVFSDEGTCQIPVFRTRPTFSLGSGDIFSAVFAFEWMVNGVQPNEAARLASLATAWYCQFRVLPLPHPLPDGFHSGPCVPHPQGRKRRVYLAGPFFNLMQLWCVQEARESLRKLGVEVFSPYHQVGTTGDARAIARSDLQGLNDSDVVFAVFDGHDPGTIFEVGYARAKGKPVILLVSNPDSTHLTMFEGTGCEVFHDLASAAYASSWVEV